MGTPQNGTVCRLLSSNISIKGGGVPGQGQISFQGREILKAMAMASLRTAIAKAFPSSQPSFL